MWKKAALAVCLLAVAAAIAWQGYTIRGLQEQLTVSPSEPAQSLDPAPSPLSESATQPERLARRERPARRDADDGLPARVDALEQAVARLTKASDYLMTRGQIPLESNKLAELQQKFMDPNTSERDRLQTLRVLRRNGPLSDEVLQHALSWIQTSTNNALREDIVQQLGGSTNSLLREPMIRLATSDPNPDVRERAVQSLQRMVGDPQVEALLWNLVLTDTDGGVREQAEEALREGPMSDTRLAALRNRAVDPNSSLDERLIAVRALQGAGASASDVTAAFAQMVQNTQDANARARIFDAFDGSTDPNMKVPLVFGLQDPNPSVRRSAADALSGYKADPAVIEWLRYIAQNDTDPRVRREAEQALRDRR
jgi:hypothetical protein